MQERQLYLSTNLKKWKKCETIWSRGVPAKPGGYKQAVSDRCAALHLDFAFGNEEQ